MYVTEINRDNGITVTFDDGSTMRYSISYREFIDSRYNFLDIRKDISYFHIMEPWMKYFGWRNDPGIEQLSDDQLSGLFIAIKTAYIRKSRVNTDISELRDETYVIGKTISTNKLDGDLVIYIDHQKGIMQIIKHGEACNILRYCLGECAIVWNEKYGTFKNIKFYDTSIVEIMKGNNFRLLPVFYNIIKNIEDVYSMGIVDIKSAD
jgi:hypothetical protein